MTKMTKIMSDDRLAAAQFRAILYSASQGIIGVDYAGTIQLANPKAEEMFGYADGELLGQSIEVLVPEHVRPIHAEERERYSEYPRARSMGLGMELKGRRRDGSEFRVEISLNHVQAGDEAMTLSLIVDVTERVEMEEHARKAHKMDAVSRLAGRVADEFTGVLTSISGSNSVALARCEGDALLRSSLEETSKATDRAAILARQLWVFASGQIAEPMWFDPNQRLSRMDGLLGRLLGENIELELALGEDVGEILADPLQVDQVIVNLVQNARDAMPDGGRLKIETAALDVGETYAHWHLPVSPGPCVMVAVTDTGVGMTPVELERIFEPLFTTKAAGQGRGFGLATVYSILRDCGGSISVSSEPNHGTTFRLIFPRIREA